MFFLILLASLAGQAILGGVAAKLAAKRHNASQRPAGLSEFNLPTADESRAIPILWGTERIDAPNVLWYGDYATAPIYTRVKTSPWSSANVITGYRYMLGLDLALCYGKIDAVTEVRMDGHVLWSGTSGAGLVNAYGTWQTDSQDDGAGAQLEIHDGTQTDASPYLTAILGAGEVPAYTGVARVLWKGPTASAATGNTSPWAAWRTGAPGATGWVGNSPQLRTIDVTAARFPAACNGAATATIGGTEANPAECLYELLTAPEFVADTAPWSARLDAAQVDLPSFAAAAVTLHAEGHGLSALYDTTQGADAIAQELLRYIDGILVTLPNGKVALRLIRAGAPSVLTLDDSSIVRVDSAARSAPDEHVNTLEVLYRDRSLIDQRATRPARAQDTAGVMFSGGAITQQTRYDYCRSATLAATLAVRDLRAACVPALRLTFAARGCEGLLPGDVATVSYTRHGLSNVRMRVLSAATPGDHTQEATIDAVEDVFAAGYATYAPPASLTPGEPEPAAPSAVRVLMAPPHLTEDALADHWLILVAPPVVGARAYTVYADSSAAPALPALSATPDVIATSAAWSVVGTTAAAAEFTTALLNTGDTLGVTLAHVEHAGYVPQSGYAFVTRSAPAAAVEYIEYSSAAVAGATVTIGGLKRGALGTLPLSLPAGSAVWLMPRRPVVDPAPILNTSASCTGTAPLGASNAGAPLFAHWYATEGAQGIAATQYRITTRTGRGELALASATLQGVIATTELLTQPGIVVYPEPIPTATVVANLPAGFAPADQLGADTYAISGPMVVGQNAGNSAASMPGAVTVQHAGIPAPALAYVDETGYHGNWAATFDELGERLPWAVSCPVVPGTFTLRWSDRMGAAAPADYAGGSGGGAAWEVLLRYLDTNQPAGWPDITATIVQHVTSGEAVLTVPPNMAAGPILVELRALAPDVFPDAVRRDGYTTHEETYPGYPEYGYITHPANPAPEYDARYAGGDTIRVYIPLTLGVPT